MSPEVEHLRIQIERAEARLAYQQVALARLRVLS